MALYHERWEHEIAYLALHHTLAAGRVLRSTDPAGLEQEIWALLTVYQAIRRAMVTAIESRPGTDPDRAGFTTALETAKDLLVTAINVTGDTTDLIGRIGRAVLDELARPGDPAPASARSNPPSRGTTRKTRTDPNATRRSPA